MQLTKRALVLLLAGGAALAAEPQKAPASDSGPVAIYPGDAKYQLPEPGERGKAHKKQGGRTDYGKVPVAWGWRLSLPDGRGLGFGGIAPFTDEPRPETEVLRDGTWTPIHAELRQRNPVQEFADRLSSLRAPVQRATQQARHGWLEGLDAKAEGKHLAAVVLPLVKEVSAKLAEVERTMAAFATNDAYFTGQIAFARTHLAFVGPALSGIAAGMGGAQFDALRQARIHLEIAADALDAAPSARALSQIAYDAKSGLFVLCGGDHLDYLGNDLWVFDPRQQRWCQRHPPVAPEPRAEHFFASGGPGKLVLKGGYIYGHRKRSGWDNAVYVNAGPEEWVYDVAADTWIAPAGQPGFPSDARYYREGGFLPDHFTSGTRPDPAAHAKKLAELPANTWVSLEPVKSFSWNRDWGTVAYDPDRDMLYWYSGGHSAYPGSDVAHYHLASNTWDQPVETELPPGLIGTNEPMVGWSFNRRPWMAHQYRSLAYHPGLKRMIVNGRFASSPPADQFCYVYDPDLGDWVSRKRTPVLFNRHRAQVLYTKEAGMLTWHSGKNNGAIWKLDEAVLEWQPMEIKGELRGAAVDAAGSVYDDRRGRALFFASTGYAKPFDGEVYAVNLATREASAFKPDGSELLATVTKGAPAAREVVRHPDSDLFVFAAKLPSGHTLALDAKKNRWVGIQLAGAYPGNSVNNGLTYDHKRGLIYLADAHARVFALRLDAQTLEVKTLAEIAAEMPPVAKPPAK